jgi:hypothetical protein
MVFDCPWGCADIPRAQSGISAGPFHENAWECPMFSQKFLEVVQTIALKLDQRSPVPQTWV